MNTKLPTENLPGKVLTQRFLQDAISIAESYAQASKKYSSTVRLAWTTHKCHPNVKGCSSDCFESALDRMIMIDNADKEVLAQHYQFLTFDELNVVIDSAKY